MTPSEQSGSLTPETGGEHTEPTVAAASEEGHPKGRIRRAFSTSRELVRIAYRDPEHVSERLTLYASQRLGEPSREWALAVREAHPDTPRSVIAEELRAQSARIARVDAAIAGTPFYVAARSASWPTSTTCGTRSVSTGSALSAPWWPSPSWRPPR